LSLCFHWPTTFVGTDACQLQRLRRTEPKKHQHQNLSIGIELKKRKKERKKEEEEEEEIRQPTAFRSISGPVPFFLFFFSF